VTADLIDVSFHPQHPRKLARVKDFGAELAHCALTWHQLPDELAVLEAITADIPALLRGADAAAVVTVSVSGKLRITAAHGPAEMVQAALHRTLEPPRWAAGRSQPAAAAHRWPVAVTLDHHAATGSMILAPLGSGQMMFGTLVVLGFATDAFTARGATDVTDVTAVAIHASIALAAARGRVHLEQAVISRDVIGQAKGILMCQRQLTAQQAFDLLLRASQHSNTKLRQVAENLCRTGELIDPPPSR